MRHLAIIGLAAVLTPVSVPASAQQVFAGGAIAGAVIGAIVAGPAGALIGAGAGGTVGGLVEAATTQPGPGFVAVQPPRPGAVVRRTCVQDRLGRQTCADD